MREVTRAAEEPRPVFLASLRVVCMWMKRPVWDGAAAAEESGAE